MQKHLEPSRPSLKETQIYRLRAESHDAIHVLLIGVTENTESRLRRRSLRLKEVNIVVRSRFADPWIRDDALTAEYDVVVVGNCYKREEHESCLHQIWKSNVNAATICLGPDAATAANSTSRTTQSADAIVREDISTDDLLLKILEYASFDELENSPARPGDWHVPTAQDGIVLVDSADRIVYVNHPARRRTRRELRRLVNYVSQKGWPNNDPPADAEHYPISHQDVRATYLEWEGTRYSVIRLNAPLLKYPDPPSGMHGRIEQNTGLPDRELFSVICNDSIRSQESNSEPMALLLIGLDRVPLLRGVIGETAYLAMLRNYSRRIREILRSDDYVACMGPQEFGVLLHGIVDSEQVAQITSKIRDRLEEEMQVLDEEISTTVSIGISLHPHDGDRIEELLRCADIALHRARENEESRYEFYNPEISANLRERLEFERRLKRAQLENHFFLHYQPIVLADSNQIVGAEALLRLQDGSTITLPGNFIPILEQTGMIRDVGRWAIDDACKQLCKWHGAGFEDFYVSVNISPRQFEDSGLADYILQCLDTYGISPCCLVLEITESVMMSDAKRTVETLDYLRDHGINTAIDDFGTGYSSLAYLKHLPVAGLKIDRAFVQNLPDDREDAAITLSLIDMARHLGLWIVAEGVEDCEQRDFLALKGVEMMQGYYYSRPVQADRLFQMLTEADNE